MAESGSKKSETQDAPVSEIDMPVWSVVSFEKCEASGLTYADAVQKMTELERKKVSGLCIVTDQAAARISA
jgi:hypothetical protein